MTPYHPPDHSLGDPNTIGGYMAVHHRPAAFEGSDGSSYSVEIVTEETGNSLPWAAYLLFVRWRQGDPIASGHLETGYLTEAETEDAARGGVAGLPLAEVRAQLEFLIAGLRTETRPWWESMNDEGVQ